MKKKITKIIHISLVIFFTLISFSCASKSNNKNNSTEIHADDSVLFASYLNNPSTKVTAYGDVYMYSGDPEYAKYFSKPMTARSMLLERAKEIYGDDVNYIINVNISKVISADGDESSIEGIIIEGLAVKLQH